MRDHEVVQEMGRTESQQLLIMPCNYKINVKPNPNRLFMLVNNLPIEKKKSIKPKLKSKTYTCRWIGSTIESHNTSESPTLKNGTLETPVDSAKSVKETERLNQWCNIGNLTAGIVFWWGESWLAVIASLHGINTPTSEFKLAWSSTSS